MIIRVALLVLLIAGVAAAQPQPTDSPPEPPQAQPQPPALVIPSEPSVALREANTAATAGDWSRVSALVQPLLAKQLERGDLAEAHRLAGIAAYLAQPPRNDIAEFHFLSYLRIDLDGHLDPALYPPEVVTFFNDVRARHAAELRARRPKGKRYWVLDLVPPFGQFQNHERTKGIVIGSLLGAFAITNVTTLLLRRSWCTFETSPSGKSSWVCDDSGHVEGARTARGLQIASGLGLIVTYVYGVYDGVRGYRRESRERALMPFASPTNQGGVVGVSMKF